MNWQVDLNLSQALRVISVEGFEFRRFSQAWRSNVVAV